MYVTMDRESLCRLSETVFAATSPYKGELISLNLQDVTQLMLIRVEGLSSERKWLLATEC